MVSGEEEGVGGRRKATLVQEKDGGGWRCERREDERGEGGGSRVRISSRQRRGFWGFV